MWLRLPGLSLHLQYHFGGQRLGRLSKLLTSPSVTREGKVHGKLTDCLIVPPTDAGSMQSAAKIGSDRTLSLETIDNDREPWFLGVMLST